MKKKFLTKVLIGLLSAGIFSANVTEIYQVKFAEAATVQNNLNFDMSIGVEKTLNFEGREIKFVAYENIVYVKNPASAESQKLIIFICAKITNCRLVIDNQRRSFANINIIFNSRASANCWRNYN